MNNDLEQFSEETLHGLISGEYFPSTHAAQALARIALAAKRAEPVAWEVKGILCHSKEEADSYVGEPTPLYDAPQLNYPEIPECWVKCSDRLPEDDEFVRIWPLPDFGVELHVGQYIKFHKEGPGWFAQVYEYNYGVEFYPITVTHWMPLPAAPEKENG
ncbi:TPA: DUF551 domain-containing protein [Yersinia enterocolitica]|nr:DUF551 domain-containing protein [Yersinia enterocolitica]